MARRRVLKSVLHNFLGTYTSRYSDLDGYWLFGFLPTTIEPWCVNLLGPHPVEAMSKARDVAHALARVRFQEQLLKNGMQLSDIQSAWLRIRAGTEVKRGEVDGREREGRLLHFEVRVAMSRGGESSAETSVFVAPHDPHVERRRHESKWWHPGA